MGKLNMGILGGFCGTVGTVVGTTNKNGVDIIRAKTNRRRNSNTVGQVEQRTKFSMVTQFMSPLNSLLKIGFGATVGTEMSPYNYACKKLLKDAIIGDSSNLELDFSKVSISEGNLSRSTKAEAVLDLDQVHFTWAFSGTTDNVNSLDKAVLVVYSPSNTELTYTVGASNRASLEGVLPLPYYEYGDTMLFYLFFQSSTDPLIVSKTQYLGSIVMAP